MPKFLSDRKRNFNIGFSEYTSNTPVLEVIGNSNFTGIVTATGGIDGVGIQSGGVNIATGIITALNFVGSGNTFALNGSVVDISISGGGGGGIAGIDTTGQSLFKDINATGVITATTFDGALATSDLTGTITNAQLAGSIANAKLTNDSVSFGGISLDLGGTDATPAFDLSDATNYPTSSLSGTITNAQLAGSIANNKLANDSVSFGGISLDLGGTDATPAFNLSDATNIPAGQLTGTVADARISTLTASKLSGALPAIDGSNLTGVSAAIAGIDTTKVSYFTHINATGIITSANFNSQSDINLKENVANILNPIDKIISINGVTFNWKENGDVSAGVIAQEVEKVFPEVTGQNGNFKVVNYNGIIGLLIEAVKEQQDQIKNLQERIDVLEGEK